MDITEEMRKKANEEMIQIIAWSNAEEEKIRAKEREKGKRCILDGDSEEIRAVHKEYKRRLDELRKKYGLEPIFQKE